MKPTIVRSSGAQAAGAAAAVPGRPPDVIAFKVWELPIRISHWVMVASIVVLCVTGYMIGRPLFSAPTEASKAYVHGTLRFVHYVAAWALTAAFGLRLYWGFAGNRFARWSRMFPVTRRRMRGLADVIAIVTGSVHYAQSHYTPLWRWIAGFGLALFGNNLNIIHLVHHQTMWFFVVYAIGHVYMVSYTMVVSRTAEVDTMISGRKFIYTEDISPYDE